MATLLAAAGLLVRTQTTGLSYAGAAALGASAGLSYLARTANFPIALLVIACLLGLSLYKCADRVGITVD